jgi:hypothetical protein
MKTSVLLLLSISAAALITLSSNSGGPANAGNAGNRTGSPNSLGTCGSCHSGATGTTMNITLRKKSDNSPVTNQYAPGAVYIVKVSGNHPSLTAFGFQIMAVKSGNTQAGTFSNFGSNYHSKMENGVTLVEHHHTLNKTGSEFAAEFEWTAPAAGAGSVTFYGALNAVNKDASTSGDAPSSAFNKVFTESPVDVTSAVHASGIKVYPNPATDILRVEIPGAAFDNCTYTIIDINGKKISEADIVTSSAGANIQIQELAKGIYFLRVANGAEITTIPFAKQ